MLDTVRCFFSSEYLDRGPELFGGLAVWDDAGMRELQGTRPVVSLSLAQVKRTSLDEAKAEMKRLLRQAVDEHGYLLESSRVPANDRAFLSSVRDDMDDVTATSCIQVLCSALRMHHGVRPIVLLDEYDAPMQEAWLSGYWDGISSFMRSLFNCTFKSNPDMGRALITGVTRVASESIFSDLNNPRVVTTTTPAYETAFGFTQAEVDDALEEFELVDDGANVRQWYDGFTFGNASGVYNPWSITCYLQDKLIESYWVNTSSNSLVSSLVRRGDEALKENFEALLNGESVTRKIDERVDFRMLRSNTGAVWSLLLATGYLRVARRLPDPGLPVVELELTNREVREGFEAMVASWFKEGGESYGEFVSALLEGDADAMTDYLGDLAEAVMSSFDSGVRPSRNLPERFWHGLVLGLLVDLRGRFEVRSNPESGRGRSDVILTPLDGTDGSDPAIVLEFKVVNERGGECDLRDAVNAAHVQMDERAYAKALLERGIDAGRIRKYGIAFQGKRVLVG